jgi:SAM-dependent methyltransferase
VDVLIEKLELQPGARVLDVGCGKAEMLVRAVERYAANGVGIDPNRSFIEAARRDSRVALHAAKVQDVALAAGSFDAALCIGSTHAFGGYRQALGALSALVRTGGTLALGEGYWKQPPAPAYLEVLGGGADEFTSHEGNIRAGVAFALKLRFATTSSDAEWDAYEGPYAAAIERFAAEHPDDADREAMLSRARTWYDAYLRWGRGTLGFGVYLFEKP